MKSRSQQFLDAMEAKDATLLPTPITREDLFYNSLVTRVVAGLTPITDEERYLLAIEAFLGAGSNSDTPKQNLFTGIYLEGYYLNGTTPDQVIYYAPGSTTTTIVPVVSGKSYKVTKSTLSNRFMTMFMNRAPYLNNSPLLDCGFTNASHDASTLEITLQAPVGATHLAIYVSNIVEVPEMTVLEI